MKKFFITIVMLMVCAVPAFASYVDNFTSDYKIKESLVLLEKNNAKEVFENLEDNSVKILFYNLGLICCNYSNHFAINMEDSFGNRYIFINAKYKDASPEELACLIAHESFHKSKVATLEEETLATQKEAHYWNKLKKSDKVYMSSALYDRLEKLVSLSEESTFDNDLIMQRIANSSFYRQQLAIR